MVQRIDIILVGQLFDIMKVYPLTRASADNFLDTLRKSMEAHLQELKQTLVNADRKVMKKAVQDSQLILTEMINRLSIHANTPPETRPTNPHHAAWLYFIREAMAIAEELLAFIRGHLFQYMNIEFPLPAADLPSAREQLTAMTDQVRSRLLTKDTVRILGFVLRPLQAITEGEEEMSYKQFQYFHQLLSLLLKIPATDDDLTCKIRTVLGHMGFNTYEFLQDLAEEMTEQVAALPSLEEKKELLQLRGKLIKQARTANQRYLQELPNPSDYISSFVEQELLYLENFQHSEPPPIYAEEDNDPTRIKMNIPVSVLAGFWKVMLHSGHVANKTKEEVLRKVPVCFEAQRGKINEHSFRTLFMNVEPNTGQAVIDLFQEWANLARKIFR